MGREVVRPGGAFDLDPLALTIDVQGLGITGYQAGDWLRTNCHVDVGATDTRRINARITHGDDGETEQRLVEALRALVARSGEIERPPAVELPSPGVPVLAPGERVGQEAVDYLTSGVRAGMLIPDAAYSSLETPRVVAR